MMFKTKLKRIWFIIFCVGVLGGLSLAYVVVRPPLALSQLFVTPTPTPLPYLTVLEVRQNTSTLNGQQIRVRGWASLVTSMTLLECPASMCDCNRAWSVLYLTEKPPHPLYGVYDLTRIAVFGNFCEGNDCRLTCFSFNPEGISALELVGTLYVDENHNFYLKDLDLEASFQLNGAGSLEKLEPTPLQIGPYQIYNPIK